MKTKSTDNILGEIKKANSIEEFWPSVDENYPAVDEYLKGLLEKYDVTVGNLVKRTNIDRVYAYQIIQGKKSHPSREKLLAISLGIGLNLDETQHLLRYARVAELYPKNPQDSIIIFAIEHKLSFLDTNELLDSMYLAII